MSDLFDAGDGETPLSPEEREGLIPTHISVHRELNELEHQNIADADTWAFGRKRNVADEVFLKGLHRRMFDRVWRWAGKYRETEKNLGVLPYQVPIEMRQLLDDAHFWIANGSYQPDELAVRFHHRLVFIHPFPNGNGRWSRLAADIMIVGMGSERFSWGSASLHEIGDVRRIYIDALKAADNHDIDALIRFARH
jgi:Fic-DOC domain mobile mystery protein B